MPTQSQTQGWRRAWESSTRSGPTEVSTNPRWVQTHTPNCCSPPLESIPWYASATPRHCFTDAAWISKQTCLSVRWVSVCIRSEKGEACLYLSVKYVCMYICVLVFFSFFFFCYYYCCCWWCSELFTSFTRPTLIFCDFLWFSLILLLDCINQSYLSCLFGVLKLSFYGFEGSAQLGCFHFCFFVNNLLNFL